MPIKDGVTGGSGAETGKVPGNRGISGIPSGVKGDTKKAHSSSGYPGFQDSTPEESDKNQSAP